MGKKRLSGFSVAGIPSKGEKKKKKKRRYEQAEGNTILVELFVIFLNGKNFPLKNIAVTNWVFSLPQ